MDVTYGYLCLLFQRLAAAFCAISLRRSYHGANDKLPAAQKSRGRQLRFDAGEASDQRSNGKISDFLYNWLKP